MCRIGRRNHGQLEPDSCTITNANDSAVKKMREFGVWQTIYDFRAKRSEIESTFDLSSQYMNMVLSMLAFIRAVRSTDWNLRLAAVNDFTKYFLALGLRNYAAMSVLHLHQFESQRHDDQEIWKHLEAGLWAPNKSGKNFCSLGADEALEQENRKIKVIGGVIGITLQPKTMMKYFLTASYVTQILDSLGASTQMSHSSKTQYHQIGHVVSSRQVKYCQSLTICIRNFNTPFKAKEKELVNLVTKLVFDPQIRDNVCRMSAFGESQHRDFVEKTMVDKSINLWDRVPNVQLKLCKSAKKKILVKTRVEIIEMKDDRNLFSHCLLICR